MLPLIFLSLAVLVRGQTVLFEDNFDTLDCSVWEHEITAGGGGNWEFQYYLNNRTNSYVRDGVLYIKPTLTEDRFGPNFVTSGTLDLWGNSPPNVCTGNGWYGCLRVGNADNLLNPIQSARLRSSKSFNFQYGRVEVSAQLPKGDWLWPAIWLLPAHNEYGDWPASGEMDLVETRGNLDMTDETGAQRGNTHGSSTLHWGPYFELNKYELTSGSMDTDFGDSFHIFALEWTPDSITTFIDGVQMLTAPGTGQSFWEFGGFETSAPGIDNPWAAGSSLAPFDQEYYIILNVAVGGTNGFFPDTWTNAGYAKPWANTSPFAPRILLDAGIQKRGSPIDGKGHHHESVQPRKNLRRRICQSEEICFKLTAETTARILSSVSDFWNARNSWYPTWAPEVDNGEQAAMKVDYVRVTDMAQK